MNRSFYDLYLKHWVPNQPPKGTDIPTLSPMLYNKSVLNGPNLACHLFFLKINLYHNKANFPYSQIICSYFYMKKAELSNCNETT